MQQILRAGDVPANLRHGFAAIGNFDGVHVGHQTMLRRLCALAQAQHAPAVAVTFDPPPLALLRPSALPPRLTTLEQKLDRMLRIGVDAVWVLPTTWDLLRLTAREFFEQIVVEVLAARGLVEGPNFFFGKDRAGTITLLRQLCVERQLMLEVIDPVMIDGQWVSSSAIRALIEQGDLDDAVTLLGHPHQLVGKVVTGAQRGRLLGFPTANLDDLETAAPGPGVYAGRCVCDGRVYAAAIHIGPNPTFGESRPKIEVHLLDFSGDLYGALLHVDVCSRLRDVHKFASPEALLIQLQQDLAAVRSRVELVTEENPA